MAEVQVTDLAGSLLDFAMATADGFTYAGIKQNVMSNEIRFRSVFGTFALSEMRYSGRFEVGGPVLEREGVALSRDATSGQWTAKLGRVRATGPNMLIAGIRCVVVSKLGKTVKIPPEVAKELGA